MDNEDGSPQYYVFCVMIYGIKVATAVVTRLIKPIVSHLHQKGVKFSIYIDDGRTVASSFDLTSEHHSLAIEIFQSSGWNIQFSKTSVKPSQQLYYQGFINDTLNMLYYLPHFKKEHLKVELDLILSRSSSNQKLSLRGLAKVVGKLVASLRALGSGIRILLRSANKFINEQAELHGWDFMINLPREVIEDLNAIRESIDEENGHPIITSKTGVQLNSIIPEASADLLSPIKPVSSHQTLGGVIASDASDKMGFAYSVNSTVLIASSMFSSSISEKSSGYRELLLVN